MAEALLVYQALWAMDRLEVPEASLADKFDRVLAAGFDGMAIDLGALSMTEAEATIPHFARTGLAGALTAFPQTDGVPASGPGACASRSARRSWS
jgi:hypothetical protein